MSRLSKELWRVATVTALLVGGGTGCIVDPVESTEGGPVPTPISRDVEPTPSSSPTIVPEVEATDRPTETTEPIPMITPIPESVFNAGGGSLGVEAMEQYKAQLEVVMPKMAEAVVKGLGNVVEVKVVSYDDGQVMSDQLAYGYKDDEGKVWFVVAADVDKSGLSFVPMMDTSGNVIGIYAQVVMMTDKGAQVESVVTMSSLNSSEWDIGSKPKIETGHDGKSQEIVLLKPVEEGQYVVWDVERGTFVSRTDEEITHFVNPGTGRWEKVVVVPSDVDMDVWNDAVSKLDRDGGITSDGKGEIILIGSETEGQVIRVFREGVWLDVLTIGEEAVYPTKSSEYGTWVWEQNGEVKYMWEEKIGKAMAFSKSQDGRLIVLTGFSDYKIDVSGASGGAVSNFLDTWVNLKENYYGDTSVRQTMSMSKRVIVILTPMDDFDEGSWSRNSYTGSSTEIWIHLRGLPRVDGSYVMGAFVATDGLDGKDPVNMLGGCALGSLLTAGANLPTRDQQKLVSSTLDEAVQNLSPTFVSLN